MDALLCCFAPLSILLVTPAITIYHGLIERAELLPSSPSRSSGVLPVLSNAPTAVEKHESEPPLTEPPTSEQLTHTVLLYIASNSEKRELAADLRGNDAQCLADYLDQLLSAGNGLNSRQKKHLFNLLLTIVKSARVFPAACEMSDVVCTFTQPQAHGGFSYTYKGTYEGQQVCVKAIRRCEQQDEAQERSIQTRAKELILQSHLFHPNVLPFLGVFLSSEESPRVCLVSLWMKNGDLSRFLKKFPESPRLPFISGIGSGLEHLHEHGFIHGDLRAETILVSDDERPVIADAGFAEVAMTMDQEGYASDIARWMAPELLREGSPRTTRSDIWSMGCIFYEVLTGIVPFAEMEGHQLVTAQKTGHITPLSDVAEEESERQGITPQLRAILVKCWQQAPQQRPTAKKLRQAVARVGTVDENTTADYCLQFSINARRSEERPHQQQLYRVLSRIIQPPEENAKEDSDGYTSGTEGDAHKISAMAEIPYVNDTAPALNAPKLNGILISDHNEVSSKGMSGTSPPPVPDEHKGNQLVPLWEKFGSVDLTGRVRRDPTQYPVHEGGFSDIYTGVLDKPSIKVSIKVLRAQYVNGRKPIDKLRKYVLRESLVWSKLSHKNVLPFLGFANDLSPSETCPALIAPYCDNKTAGEYVCHTDLMIETRIKIISGVACGLEYLHEKDIVHGDLKPSNILISDNGEPLLCDFGQSRILGSRGFTTKPAGAERYQARELMAGDTTPNKSTDVCAFGLTTIELWTSTKPYAHIKNNNAVARDILLYGLQQELPNPVPPMADSLWPILAPCFSHEPEYRPPIADITRKLELLSSSL